MANEQSFKSLNDESLGTSDLFSNRKRKVKEVCETVRKGKGKWFDAEGDRPRTIFWANQYDAGLFSKDSW